MALTLLVFAGPLHSQQSRAPALWSIELPGGSYQVALSQITSVSRHEYIVDSAARVTEVTIDTTGSALARFYYLEPLSPEAGATEERARDRGREAAEQLLERLGVDAPWRQVVKNYPTTTHAHTIEYRLNRKEDVDAILSSVREAWQRNREAELELE